MTSAQRCQRSVAEILSDNNITPGHFDAAGSGYTTCPQCSPLRKPENRNKRVLRVSVGRDGVQWFCNHCSWSGGDFVEARPGVRRAREYDYKEESGKLLFQTLRFRHPKDFRQRRPDGNGGWRWNLDGVRRVLYRLPELLAAKNTDPKRPVFIVEGEKDADKLRQLGAVATCNPMGAGKWRPEYSETLRGFDTVVVIADKDDAGRAHAEQVAASVAPVVGHVKVIELPDERVKDASDFIAADGTLDEIYHIAAAMPDWAPTAPHGSPAQAPEGAGDSASWPEPDMRLVEDDRVSAPALDNDALPAGWEDWITSEAAARACPPDYIAASLIGAASGFIGNARRIAATADWNEPAHLWFANVGVPSAGKTPALQPMTEVSRRLERNAEPAWRETVAQYERNAEAATAREKAWREKVQEAAQRGRALPDRPTDAQQPLQPPRPRLIAMDCSTEELQRMLAEAPRGLIYVRDELAGWLGGFDRYGGNGADRAFFLECWNGGAYVCDRVRYHGEPIRIEHASLAIVGGMVPDRLREVLADADDGLTSRLIFIWPEPPAITELVDRGDKDAALRRQALLDAAHRLRDLEMGADEHGAPAPIAVRLDEDARQLFDEIRRDAMEKARSAHGLAAGWYGKNPGRAQRLAL
ncbi:MAG TPA: DUF3987 domain-containing protein, partial [Candidatus Solibacter sp.]|nr:DUF3987 domain-containing protein [Candidatus Solibacter sp.]